MIRKAFIYDISEDQKTAIYIDEENADVLRAFLKNNRKKFYLIIRCIFDGIDYPELFCREIVKSRDIRNVYAMKAFKGGSNPRIYCQKKTVKGLDTVVVCCELLPKKKTEGNEGKTLRVIERVSSFQYDEDQLIEEYESLLKEKKKDNY